MIEPAFYNSFSDLTNFTQFLIRGDRKNCLLYLEDYLKKDRNIIKVYEEILKKSLYQVGDLWEYNKISVASEHLATSISESLLNHLYENQKFANRIGKKIILANTENEIHQLGIKMVADVFESFGWEVIFLGSSVTLDDLNVAVKTLEPDLLALSLSIQTNYHHLEKTLQKINSTYSNLPIIVGGRAFLKGGATSLTKFNNVFYISDLYALELFIQSFEKNAKIE